MSEQPDLSHAQVYGDYAQQPDANPDLLGRMRRLAASETSGQLAVSETVHADEAPPSPEVNPFETLEQHSQRLAKEKRIAELKQKPQGECADTAICIVEALNDEELPATFNHEELEALVSAGKWDELDISQARKLITAVTLNREKFGDTNQLDDLVDIVASSLSQEKLDRLYFQKGSDGSLSPLMTYVMCPTTDFDHKSTASSIVSYAYQDKGGAMWVPPGQDAAVDLLHDFSNYAHSAIFDLPIKPNDIDDGGSVEEFELETRHKIHFILRQHMGLSEKITQSFMRAHDSAWHRSPIDNDIAQDYHNKTAVKTSLELALYAVKGLSESQLDLLTQQLGVVNFDRYYPDDLATLLSILGGEQGTIEHLKKGDVTVIFADAFGDRNGALQRVNEKYQKPSGRTLQFEIAQRRDFNRAITLLMRAGIKPSTIVIAAHGRPGETYFGEGQDRFVFATSEKQATKAFDADKKYHLNYGSQIKDLVCDFMQDSRGVDDPATCIDRRRIIVHSCSSDVNPEQFAASTAKTLALLARHPKLDVYAAKDVTMVSSNGTSIQFIDENGKAIGSRSRLTRSVDGEPVVKTTHVSELGVRK